MRKEKRWMAGLLAAVFTVTALPGTVWAENEDAGGRKEITEIEWGTKPPDGETVGQPFPSGTGGSDNFRIPGLVTLDDGTLVAACDARWDHAGDACGLDTVVSRSTDNGENWKYTFANYLGDYGNKKHLQSTAFIDPAITTDGKNVYMIADVWPGGYAINTAPNAPIRGNEFDEDGNLILSGDNRRSYGYHLERNYAADADEDSYYVIIENESGNAVEGFTVDAFFNITDGEKSTNLFCANSPYLVYPTDYLYLTKSEDGGANWSIPSLLRVKKPAEKSLLVGPGRGIVTSTGRIVFTAYEFTDGDRNSACIYSDDGGLTWERGESVPQVSSEAAIVEADGKLFIFTRHGGYNISEDWGETWSEKKNPTITYNLGCELSAITYSKKIDGKTAIIFSAPSNTGGRTSGKLFVGLVNNDGTIDWKYEYSVNGNAYYAYSCLTELNDGSIGLLYENAGAAITYTNIAIEDIIGSNAVMASAPWCEDKNGTKTSSVTMKPNASVEYQVRSSADSPVWTVRSSHDENLTASITDGKLTITSKNCGFGVAQEMLVISDGTNTTYLPVAVSETTEYLSVKLRMGDVKNYTIADETSLDRTNLNESVAKVTETKGKIKIEGIAEGTTSFQAGDRIYYITVKNDVREISLDIGESMVMKGVMPEIDAYRQTVLLEENPNEYPYEPVTKLTDGKYLIGTESHIVTSGDSKATDPLGRAMQAADFEGEDLTQYMWTIAKTEEGYTIVDNDGKYMEFKDASGESCEVNVSDAPQTLQIQDKFGSFSISNGKHYLNNFSNANVRAAGYNKDNNSWFLYQKAESYVVKGKRAGTFRIVKDGTNYNITVGEPLGQEVETEIANLETKLTEAEKYLTGGTYPKEAVEALRSVFEEAKRLMEQETLSDAKALREMQQKLNGAIDQILNPAKPGEPPANPEKPKLPAVGSTYSDGKATYVYTSSTASGGTVTYVKPSKKTEKKIKIPASITVDRRTYLVTVISANAMKNNKNLREVTVGANVKTIGKSAFEKCGKLKKITIQSKVLKSVGKKAIKGIDKKCTIKVPKKNKAAYKKLFKKTTGFKSTMKLK